MTKDFLLMGILQKYLFFPLVLFQFSPTSDLWFQAYLQGAAEQGRDWALRGWEVGRARHSPIKELLPPGRRGSKLKDSPSEWGKVA